MTISINEHEYELKYSFRSLMIYENITGKTFEPKGLTDVLVFFYATVLAADKHAILTFENFMDWIDENPNSVLQFSEWLTASFQQNGIITPNQDETKSADKDASKNA